MIFDYHIHSDYSADGKMTIEEACKRSIELGLKEIAFTEHLDIDWPDPGLEFDKLDIDRYMIDIEKNRKRFKDYLTIKSGIEIGLQPHVLEETAQVIRNYPFDFVIASIHIIQRMDPYQGNYYYNRTKEECYRLYYEETLRLISEFSDFEVLGHIGYIKRYSPFPYQQGDELLCSDLIEKILKRIITMGKGIEINTSGYRHISNSPMPSPEIIKKYRELGGRIITLGSDAHKVSEIGFGIKTGEKLLKDSGFECITTYTARKAEFIQLNNISEL